MSTTKLPPVSIISKLQKRTLRSKIAKILNSFKPCCGKMLGIERQITNIENKKTEIFREEQDDINRMQVHPPMRFSPAETHRIHEVESHEYSPQEIQQYLKNHLSKLELLEIGEDPAYFISNVELRNLSWLEGDWMQKQSIKPITKKKGTIPIDSNSHLLKKIEKPVLNNFDGVALKRQIVEQEQQDLIERNEYRQHRFRENYHKEQQIQLENYEKMNLKYIDKIKMTNKRVDAKIQGVLKTKEFHQQESMAKLYHIKDYLKQEKEVEEIKTMTAQLKQLCLDKQIMENRTKHFIQVIDRAQSCQKFIK